MFVLVYALFIWLSLRPCNMSVNGCVDEVCIYEHILCTWCVTLRAVGNWGELQTLTNTDLVILCWSNLLQWLCFFSLVILFHVCMEMRRIWSAHLKIKKSLVMTIILYCRQCMALQQFEGSTMFVNWFWLKWPLGTLSCSHLRFNRYVADRLARQRGWTWVIDHGPGWKLERSLGSHPPFKKQRGLVERLLFVWGLES